MYTLKYTDCCPFDDFWMNIENTSSKIGNKFNTISKINIFRFIKWKHRKQRKNA